MAPAKDTYLPAIRESVARARVLATRGPCEGCGAQISDPYAFAFGRIAKKETRSEGSTTIYTTYYDPIDARVVRLCRECVELERRKMLGRIRNQNIVVGILMIVGLPMIAFYGLQVWYAIPALALIGLALTFLLSPRARIREIKSDIRVAGQARALALCREELRRQGFTAFWSEPGYTL
jgi:hypothetical protein